MLSMSDDIMNATTLSFRDQCIKWGLSEQLIEEIALTAGRNNYGQTLDNLSGLVGMLSVVVLDHIMSLSHDLISNRVVAKGTWNDIRYENFSFPGNHLVSHSIWYSNFFASQYIINHCKRLLFLLSRARNSGSDKCQKWPKTWCLYVTSAPRTRKRNMRFCTLSIICSSIFSYFLHFLFLMYVQVLLV